MSDDIVVRLLAAYENMGTGSREDLKLAAEEITSLREKLREAQQQSDYWYIRNM